MRRVSTALGPAGAAGAAPVLAAAFCGGAPDDVLSCGCASTLAFRRASDLADLAVGLGMVYFVVILVCEGEEG